VSANHERKDSQVVGFFGVGFDNKDGHQRLTRSEHFLLLGGSDGTHELMQDAAIRFEEALRDRGKRLADTSLPEVIELLEKSLDS
jgi:hypothetical protein